MNISNKIKSLKFFFASIKSLYGKIVNFEKMLILVDAKISGIDERATVLDAKTSSIDDRATVLDTKISSIDDRATVLDAKISSIDDRAMVLNAKVAALDEKSTTVSTNRCLERIKSGVVVKEKKAGLSNEAAKLSNLEIDEEIRCWIATITV